jgi:iron complex outermembrane receptor protein
MQIFLFLPCGHGFMTNSAGSQIDGADLELTLSPTDSLQIALGGAYIDAVLTGAAPGGAPAGSPLPTVAQLTWHGSVLQEFALGNQRSLFARAGVRYVGESYSDFFETLHAPSYEIIDLRIGLETSHWTVSIFAENLLDEYGIVTTVDDFGLQMAGDWQNLIRPRTIGLDLRVNFE